jgi:glycerophosphoryl diester phosphodiesterase
MGVYNNNKDGTRSIIANTIQVVDAPIEQFVSRGEFSAVTPNDVSADNKLVAENEVTKAVDTMPTASVDLVGTIVQYVGTTTPNYTNGYFYKCISDGAITPTYSWVEIINDASSLSDLSDTSITTPQSGDVLVYNGEEWINGYSNTPKNNLFIIAHRGLYTSEIPENTIAAFKNAIRDGYSWIEIDVLKTQDEVFILGHDASPTLYKNGVAETVKFSNITYSQLQEYTWDSAGNYHIDTLAHTLFALKNMNVNIIIDNKLGENSFMFIIPIIKQYGMRDRCLLSITVAHAKKYLDDLKKFPDIKLRITDITSASEFEAVASEISNELYLDLHAYAGTMWSVNLPICLSLGYPIIVSGINRGTGWAESARKHVINCVAGVMSDNNLTYKEFVNLINTDLNVNDSMIICQSWITLNDTPITLNAQNTEAGGGYINMYSNDNSVATVTCTQRGETAVSTITPVNDGMCEIYVFNPSMSVPIPCIVASNGAVGLIGDINDEGTNLATMDTKLSFCSITGDSDNIVKTITRNNAEFYSTKEYYGNFYLMEVPEGATRFTANVDTSIENTFLYIKFYDSSKTVVSRSTWSQTKDITIESNYKYIAIGCRIGDGSTLIRQNNIANEHYDKVVSSVSFGFE